MASMNNDQINKLYEAQQKQRIAALQNQRIAAEQGLRSQEAGINQAADKQRSQIDTTSRMNAIGNNERLASMGLAGGANTSPISGYSETSRQRDNTALRTGLNNATLQQQGALNQINRDVQTSNIAINQQKAQQIADLQAQRGAAQINQFNADRGYENTVAQQKAAQANADRAYGLQQQQFNYTKEQNQRAYDLQQQALKAQQEQYNASLPAQRISAAAQSIINNPTLVKREQSTNAMGAVVTNIVPDYTKIENYINGLNLSAQEKAQLKLQFQRDQATGTPTMSSLWQ